MAKKVLSLIASCRGCPHYTSRHCGAIDEIVHNPEIVAPFCPLPDYPSHRIAQMEATIEALREPYIYGYSRMLLAFVAAKLKLNLSADGMSVTIVTKDEREIRLHRDYIIDLGVQPGFEIEFKHGKDTFRLLPETNPPSLSEVVEKDIEGEARKFWHDLQIA